MFHILQEKYLSKAQLPIFLDICKDVLNYKLSLHIVHFLDWLVLQESF